MHNRSTGASSGSSSGDLLVATEDNVVHAIDAVSGQERWQRLLGKPVPRSSLSCGNMSPLGVTGTPVIDASTEAIYLNAGVETSSGPRHLVFALSLKDGTPLPGWPIDIVEALARQGQTFVARDQNQRGALAILARNLYVPFGGHFGDCGQYRGFVVGISLSDPRTIKSWATRARGGGIWAPGGISTDGTSLFVATGNTFGARTWSDGEAVIRLAPDLHRSDDKRDFFAPSDWEALDARDADRPEIYRAFRQPGQRLPRSCLKSRRSSSALRSILMPELPNREVLAGLIERVTYHNSENGFCVLRAKVRGHAAFMSACISMTSTMEVSSTTEQGRPFDRGRYRPAAFGRPRPSAGRHHLIWRGASGAPHRGVSAGRAEPHHHQRPSHQPGVDPRSQPARNRDRLLLVIPIMTQHYPMLQLSRRHRQRQLSISS